MTILMTIGTGHTADFFVSRLSACKPALYSRWRLMEASQCDAGTAFQAVSSSTTAATGGASSCRARRRRRRGRSFHPAAALPRPTPVWLSFFPRSSPHFSGSAGCYSIGPPPQQYAEHRSDVGHHAQPPKRALPHAPSPLLELYPLQFPRRRLRLGKHYSRSSRRWITVSVTARKNVRCQAIRRVPGRGRLGSSEGRT